MDIYLAISITTLLFSISGFIMGLMSFIKSSALEKSTHSVQYMPIEDNLKGLDPFNDDLTPKMSEDDFWGTKPAYFKEDAKLYKEQLEKDMPEFAPDDYDKKVRSF